jgi:hypothetical protein
MGFSTFPFWFIFSRYSLTSPFPAQNDMYLVSALRKLRWHPSTVLRDHLPSPFAGCKTFHAGKDGSINQILLGLAFWIGKELNEG